MYPIADDKLIMYNNQDINITDIVKITTIF